MSRTATTDTQREVGEHFLQLGRPRFETMRLGHAAPMFPAGFHFAFAFIFNHQLLTLNIEVAY